MHRPYRARERKQWDKGLSSQQHRITGPALQKRNRRIHIRDKFTCQNRQCNLITNELEVDHRLAVAAGGSDSDDNLRCLCIQCHAIKSKIESQGKQLPDPDSWPLTYVAAKRLVKQQHSNELPMEQDDHDGVVHVV